MDNFSSLGTTMLLVCLKRWLEYSRDEDGFKVYRKEVKTLISLFSQLLKRIIEEFEDIDIRAGKKYSYKVSSF